jgi:Family of unknown function (DUF6163)
MRFQLDDNRRKRTHLPTLAETSFNLVCSTLGLISLGFAIAAMARLIGFEGFSPARFDLMPVHWRITETALSVMFAAAGFGLWQRTNWGLAMWVAASAIVVARHTIFVETFGSNTFALGLICAVSAIYVLFWVLSASARRRARLAKN